jgi:putative CocE/NonD family hydrolase
MFYVLHKPVLLGFLLLLPALTNSGVPGERQFVAKVPMRDGVRLSMNVFLPETKGRFPTLLVRTPYDKGKNLIASYDIFLENRYAVAVQDVRGRYASDGSFRPLTQEIPDGDDTISWIAKQPWSNGKVGMLGGSYVGIVQWRAALANNPHLIAIFPIVAGSDEYRDRFYSRGGAMKVGHRLHWISQNLKLPWPFHPEFDDFVHHLPLRTADRIATGHSVDFWQQALDHPADDEFWRERSTYANIDKVRTPAFIVGGWYDNFVEGDLDAYAVLSKRSAAHRIIIGPWPHSMSAPYPSGITFGPKSGAAIRRLQVQWFDYWMKSKHPAPEFHQPRVRIFVMGVNRWRDEEEWPLSRARPTPFYLDSDRGANTLKGDGKLVDRPGHDDEDTYVYDPKDPVPTAGGSVCCDPRVIPWGPMDQRAVESRSDVLVYTSEPLKGDLEVTGTVRVALEVSSSAPDTDFTAKLVDVYPDGYARNLCDGILRLRYRDGLDRMKLASPGEIYRIVVDAGVTSNVFRAGHRIRLDISSSNFPRFDRNPNTGAVIAEEREMHTARQAVFHGKLHPSQLVLPVIP